MHNILWIMWITIQNIEERSTLESHWIRSRGLETNGWEGVRYIIRLLVIGAKTCLRYN